MTEPSDVLCRSIMSLPPATLKPDDSIRYALESLVRHQFPALPVVEADGRYVGMLPRSRLIALAMPSVLSHQDATHPLSHFQQAGFIHDSLADLQSRLAAAAGDPVSQHLDADVPILEPHTPLINAMLFLYRQRNVLPVVENGQLLGVVSVWDVLARIGRIK